MDRDEQSELVDTNSFGFAAEVLESTQPVLLDVSSPWCRPCLAAEPALRDIATRYSNRLKVVRLDGSNSPDVAAKYSIRGFPTFLGFHRGELLVRRAGFGGAASLEALANSLLELASGIDS